MSVPVPGPVPGPPPGPGGYQSSPSPMRWVLIGVAGCGLIGLLSFVALFVVAFVQGFKRGYQGTAPQTSNAAAVLDQSYSTRNGFATIHYPSDFAAKNLDDSTITISRNLGGGQDEAVLLAAVDKPISDDVNEVARVLLVKTQKHVESDSGTYRELSRENSDCLPGVSGVTVHSEATLKNGDILQMSTCFAIRDNRAYELKTIVPKNRAKAELPLLNRILASTEIRQAEP